MAALMPSDVRPVVGWSGYYVDPRGCVWSVHVRGRSTTGQPHALKGETTRKGYCAVTLSDGFGYRRRFVHALVAEAFIGPRPPGMTVNHIDGDKRNNVPGNLEYLSPGDNRRHAVRAGLYSVTAPYRLDAEKADQIRELSRGGMSSRALAVRFAVSRGSIQDILRGRSYKLECA